MNRFSRINTIWRKELIDTLRDRRTLVAMVLVPMVLYPALMLGSLQAFEIQHSRLKREEYRIAVGSEREKVWLESVIQHDRHLRAAGPAGPTSAPREEAESGAAPPEGGDADAEDPVANSADAARRDVRSDPPAYRVVVVSDVAESVRVGDVHVGIVIRGELPTAEGDGSADLRVLYDESEFRGQLALAGVEGILERADHYLVTERLRRASLQLSFVRPLAVGTQSVATPEKRGGSVLGQIVPLILIVMTITGAIYPAIDLTAGERERGTMETLMVAPVPAVDLIAGKFVVVAMIGMLSAALNLLSIGGTIYLGGLGDLLTRGNAVIIPLSALPLVLVVLVPLAVMFSALLLAVCSFARSFKEAQNYVMPVMVAALIPAIVGALPGTRLDGPMLIMPVTNIVVLTRDLFTGRADAVAILWVMLSTSMYAAAAVAVAAKLFGQEAVLFADSASIKTVFQRRFFKPSRVPTAAQAFLLIALTYSLNYFAQVSLQQSGMGQSEQLFYAIAALLLIMFVVFPLGALLYMRIDVGSALRLQPPRPRAMLAALCLGLSTWVLASAWAKFQSGWLPLGPEMADFSRRFEDLLLSQPVWILVILLAAVPAVCEELFFRGYALSGLRGALGTGAAVAVVAVTFGLHHHSIHRLAITTGLGLLLGLLVVRGGSIWPAMLAHFLHNGLSVLSAHPRGLQPLLERLGYPSAEQAGPDGAYPPAAWLIGAAILTGLGIVLSLTMRESRGMASAGAATIGARHTTSPG